jgi:putative ABC transport system permease protein
MMISPRWVKILRDATGDRGRSLMLVTAVSAGVFGISTILTAYSILTREIQFNYESTNPASATLELDAVTDRALAIAKDYPGVADAERRSVILARVKVGDDWNPMLLFVIDDFDKMRLNTFRRVSGAWPPPSGTMLVERSAIRVFKAGEGGSVTIKTPHGRPTLVPISGIVHDTTLAPAWQEQYGYGYIARETLPMLGEQPILDELRIQVEGKPSETATIESKAQSLAIAFREHGIAVHELKVPPPKKHPHQDQMRAVLLLFVIFATMALVLSAILVAAALTALLAKQVREIGVMKAIGARTAQVARMYVSMVLALGAVSVGLGLPLGLAAGRRFAELVGDELLNFTIYSDVVPAWVYAVVIASGVLVPLLVSLPTIMRGTRLTVREAIADFGVSPPSFGQGRFETAVGALRGMGLPYLLAMRNMFRRRGRLILALALLAAGGGMFVTALNVRDGWEVFADRVNTDRFYDVEFRLNDSTPAQRIVHALSAVKEVRELEMWGYRETAFAREGEIDVARVYPDRAHGSFSLLGVPSDTKMIRFPVLRGRWLQPDDTNAVVLNQTAFSVIPTAKIGDTVLLSIDGMPTRWTLAGVVEEVGSPPAAYIADHAFAAATRAPGTVEMVRLSTSANNAVARTDIIRRIEVALDTAGISVQRGMPKAMLRTAMGDHVAVLVSMLIATAVLLALIGGLGLASTMMMNVVERTREIGVMRSIGATPAVVLKIILSEGVFVGVTSWVFAVLLSLPLSKIIGVIVGNLAFRTPLALAVSYPAVLLWLGLVVGIAAIASTIPARRASRLVIREALAYG